MEFFAYPAYILIGILAGLSAGLLGISGGFITVPLLALVFYFLKFPQAFIMQLAIGTSLAAMFFTGISSSWAHHLKGAVVWDLVKTMLLGLIFGSILGALVAHLLSSVILEVFFGLLAIGVGFYFYRDRFKMSAEIKKLPKWLFTLWGFGIAFISNILGIGGGIITVPVLISYHYPEKKAIGTSAVTGMIISFLGALAYLYFGMGQIIVPGSIGYLFLPAFLCVAVASMIAAPFGAKLAHRLQGKKLKKLFGVFLIIVGLLMVF